MSSIIMAKCPNIIIVMKFKYLIYNYDLGTPQVCNKNKHLSDIKI